MKRLLLSTVAAVALQSVASAASRPNIIVIMADDLGYSDVGCYGCKDIPTPHIDRLADEGARFATGYVTWHMCGPSRAGFLTGRHQSTFGYYKNQSLPFDPKQGLPKMETIASLLQKQGYVTGGVGKWHMGTTNDQHPNSMGFDDWFGFLSGGLMYYPLDHPSYKGRFTPLKRPAKWRDIHHTLPLIHNMEPVKWDQYLTRELTDAGIRFLEKNASTRSAQAKPFFLFMSYNAPHLDLEAPKETIAKFPAGKMTKVPGVKPEARSIYGAMVYEMDQGIGKLLEKVDELGLADNTVVWFLSDNGGMKRTSDNRPLRGSKGNAYEGGLRVPMIVKWPGKTPEGVVLEEAVTSLDIGATAIAMAGGDPVKAGLHGKDIRPYMTQQSREAPHDLLYWHTAKGNIPGGVIREGDFKLVVAAKGETELYNLKDDLGESTDLAASQPEHVQGMLARWKEWNKGSKPDLWGTPTKAYQYADYEWLKGSQHYRANSKRVGAALPAPSAEAQQPSFAKASAFAKATADKTAGRPVSVESLLAEMVDRESVARFPERNFRLKQHSSYNRASKTPEEPVGWFTNKDFNSKASDRNFVRIEENNGQKEWVLMDHEGPGAIVRSWMPWRNPNRLGTDINMRIYLDGSDEPALEGNMLGMFTGDGVIPYPFAHPSLRSAVNFFPIPYARSCKVTTDKMPFFFIFTFREYDEGTPVKTFSKDDFEAAEALTAETGKLLLNPTVSGTDDSHPTPPSQSSRLRRTSRYSATLYNQEEKPLALPAGTAAVRELSVKLGSYADPNVMRQVVLKIEFDGRETVWCPVGDFFGSGIGLNPVQGWYRTVAEDGKMTCRWVMPYRKGGRVSLLNLSGAAVDADLEVKTGSWTWGERSMYFHAGWRGQYPVSTQPRSDWNYVTLKGRGVYVGDTLTIMNPVEKWWGEGDEKIWVDGEDFPSLFGTGTEDYYAYSWGGMSTDFYEHPFHAQPRAHKWNKLNRKPETEAGTRNTLGYSVETRSRALDAMPFGTSLQLDMEVWSWSDVEMGYGVGVYWYGDADTTSNRKPEPVEVLNVPPLPNSAVSEAADDAFKGAVEIGPNTIISKSGKIVLKPQDLKKMKLKGSWNSGNHLLFKGSKVGDVVEFCIPAASPVAEKLTLHATRSYDFGIVRFSVNGKPAGAKVDLYAARPVPSGAIKLGAFDPVDSAYLLRVEVVGKNPKSKGTFFGLDCVTRAEAN
jgi:arylsulfatase A-like enzyme